MWRRHDLETMKKCLKAIAQEGSWCSPRTIAALESQDRKGGGVARSRVECPGCCGGQRFPKTVLDECKSFARCGPVEKPPSTNRSASLI